MAESTYLEIIASAGFGSAPASSDFLAWLARIKAPPEIVDLLAPGLPTHPKRRRRLGDRCDLYTEAEIEEEAGKEPQYLRAGLLAIGSGVGGDPLVLDLRKQVGAVGYLDHEEIWSGEGVRIRKHLAIIAPSLAEFARLSVEARLPIDYSEARKKG